MFCVQQLSGGYQSEIVLKNISFEVKKGELLGILGPNGSGKTTLLKMLSGVIPFQQGDVLIDGKSLITYKAKELAQIVAVLSQHSAETFSYTVKETVSLGRYAHQNGWFQSWSKADEEVVQRVMKQTGISSLKNKNIQALSGGEKQRVCLAQALAQEPKILLLDEPTNHLDLSYQKELLDLLKRWTTEMEMTVISIFHDLNLAALYCDRLLLLEKGEIKIHHTPNEVLKEDRIKDVYHTSIQKQSHPTVAATQMVLLPEVYSGSNWMEVNETMLHISNEMIRLWAPMPLRVMSSGVVGSEIGWYQTFINQHVDEDDNTNNYPEEMAELISSSSFEPSETVGMMTTANLEDVSYKQLKGDGFSIFVVVTSGIENAVDTCKNELKMTPGNINTWVFVNGILKEEAFIQSIVTATEAKVNAIYNHMGTGTGTNTITTRTSNDSIFIAATQSGNKIEFVETNFPLGELINQAVYQCTVEAIEKSRRRSTRLLKKSPKQSVSCL
jgi:iron complex transport system ATP-binding protein